MTTGLLAELKGRLTPLLEVGLCYLTLDRPGAPSTGERPPPPPPPRPQQPARRAVVLDEPSTGLVPTARSGSTGKVVSAREAVRLIRIGNTVAIGGFFEIGLALEVIHELGALFEATDEESAAFGRPRDLTLVFCVSPGDWASGGANRLAQPGLVKRIIGGHWSAVPALYQLVAGNQTEGYNMPLGPMSHLYRDIAAGKPGHLSRVGLGTFADPRFGGGKLNEMTTEDLVELVAIGGEEYLFYKAFPVNVAIIRGTTADSAGNITMEREALTCDTL